MKKIVLGTLILAALSLSGCGKYSSGNSDQKKDTNSSIKIKSKNSSEIDSNIVNRSKKTSHNASKQNNDLKSSNSLLCERKLSGRSYKTIWNDQKLDQLKNYMNQFGAVMNQKYEQVTFSSNSSWYNVNLSDYAKENKSINIAGQSYKTNWFNTHAYYGTKYIPAAYVDNDQHILYLFIANEGDNVVLVSQQEPNANGELMMKETSNQDLLNAFIAIGGGNNPDTESSSISNSKNSEDSSEPPLFTIPQEFTGTWYSADGDQITLSGTTFSESGNYSFKLHDGNAMSEEEQEAARTDASAAHNDWGIASTKMMEMGDGVEHNTLLVRNWNRNGGNAYLYVTDETVDGRSVRVLNYGESDFSPTTQSYYPTQADADQTD